ncbi:aldo/keto reductase [Micromonospora zamorensis]|uniref:aldo/keto reductase n=1 Tax=Micromonospora zamorensis TaxID=709883 RepID=UPI0033AFDF9D
MDLTDQPTALLPGDVRMPLLGFGTWQATGQAGYDAVLAALDTGYRHLDTATMYGNEREVGRAVRESGLRREDIFITTKLPPDRVGRERATLEASLEALGVDQVDLWLIHWPPSSPADSIPLWRELLAARDENLVRAVGVSNYSTGEIDELIQSTEENPAVNQIRWSPSLYDRQRHAEHRDRGVVLEGYSPFKTSDLSDPVLTRIAGAHGVSPAQVVLRWHIDHEIVVIPKSVTPERITANFDVFHFSLTAEEMRDIDALGEV